MFGFSSPSELPLSTIPVGVVVSTTASIPVETLAQILKDNDIPVEAVSYTHLTLPTNREV